MIWSVRICTHDGINQVYINLFPQSIILLRTKYKLIWRVCGNLVTVTAQLNSAIILIYFVIIFNHRYSTVLVNAKLKTWDITLWFYNHSLEKFNLERNTAELKVSLVEWIKISFTHMCGSHHLVFPSSYSNCCFEN